MHKSASLQAHILAGPNAPSSEYCGIFPWCFLRQHGTQSRSGDVEFLTQSTDPKRHDLHCTACTRPNHSIKVYTRKPEQGLSLLLKLHAAFNTAKIGHMPNICPKPSEYTPLWKDPQQRSWLHSWLTFPWQMSRSRLPLSCEVVCVAGRLQRVPSLDL